MGSEMCIRDRRNTLDEITRLLNNELRSGYWTDECSSILSENPQVLYLFDRFEYVLSRAYGLPNCKIALNPLMILCCHPDCIAKKPIVRLKHLFDIKDYIKHHVSRHLDEIGKSIRLRYSAVAEDPFISV